VTGCSAFTLRDAETRFGLRPGRGEVIFNGVEPRPAPGPDADNRSEVDAPPGGLAVPYVLALGRAVAKKGFDLLVGAFALISERHPDVVLAIGGDGPALPGLERLIDQLGVKSRVMLLGRLSRPEVSAAMGSAEIFVMPSRLEPFGIVILEAWRAGRAVVATSRGGAPEFVDDGENGALVDPFDTAELAETLSRLLSEPARREALGEAGRRRVNDFSWQAIVPAYKRCYATAIGAARRAGP
jgi:glycogen(starch) synthase